MNTFDELLDQCAVWPLICTVHNAVCYPCQVTHVAVPSSSFSPARDRVQLPALRATLILYVVIKHCQSQDVTQDKEQGFLSYSRILKPQVHKNTQEFKVSTGLTTLSQFRRLNKHIKYQEGSKSVCTACVCVHVCVESKMHSISKIMTELTTDSEFLGNFCC